jgi:hypothetical protein
VNDLPPSAGSSVATATFLVLSGLTCRFFLIKF